MTEQEYEVSNEDLQNAELTFEEALEIIMEDTPTNDADPKDLLYNLGGFIGTLEYHRWNILTPHVVLTDGALYLAETAKCYWLMDVIASYQRTLLMREEYFQVWKIVVTPPPSENHNRAHAAVITCDDGNGHTLIKQEVPYTDFPLDEYEMYAVLGDGVVVIMLKSEY